MGPIRYSRPRPSARLNTKTPVEIRRLRSGLSNPLIVERRIDFCVRRSRNSARPARNGPAAAYWFAVDGDDDQAGHRQRAEEDGDAEDARVGEVVLDVSADVHLPASEVADPTHQPVLGDAGDEHRGHRQLECHLVVTRDAGTDEEAQEDEVHAGLGGADNAARMLKRA